MILGFKDRFVPFVEDGSKRHTVRDGKRWRSGMRADLFAKVRQKGMRLIFRAPVVRVQDITISHDGIALAVTVCNEPLDAGEMDLFFHRDGFRDPMSTSRSQAAAFWAKKLEGGRVFDGQIIHWDFERRTHDA